MTKELRRFFEPLSLLNDHSSENIKTLRLLMSILQWSHLKITGKDTKQWYAWVYVCMCVSCASVFMHVWVGILNISISITIFKVFLFLWHFNILVVRKNGTKRFRINQNKITSFSFINILLISVSFARCFEGQVNESVWKDVSN